MKKFNCIACKMAMTNVKYSKDRFRVNYAVSTENIFKDKTDTEDCNYNMELHTAWK